MGKDSRKNIFSIQREQILDLYKAGPDAVVSFITQFQDFDPVMLKVKNMILTIPWGAG